ncbi:hypothetical protein LNP74_32110 [Klebsiella pneumoniae subsp. pneumoniae]|nr:hypothetical protein [Klebsiella pneumoniae subsp. pneumoniae]
MKPVVRTARGVFFRDGSKPESFISRIFAFISGSFLPLIGILAAAESACVPSPRCY